MDLLEIAAFIAAITQVVKQLNIMPAKYLPLVAIVVGGIMAAIVGGISDVALIVEGLALGLATTGMVGVTKDTLAKIGK